MSHWKKFKSNKKKRCTFRFWHFPSFRKHVNIIPIRKSGEDPALARSYRPTHPHTLLATYVDNTAIMTGNKNTNYIHIHLQAHIFCLNNFFLTLPLYLNGSSIEFDWEVKYLGIILDSNLKALSDGRSYELITGETPWRKFVRAEKENIPPPPTKKNCFCSQYPIFQCVRYFIG